MRVLVIDDNLADQFLVREAAETTGFPLDLTFALDGEHGLALLRHRAQGVGGELPHLILLDLHMPGLSGMEVLGRLMEDEQLTRIPVVMLTTSSLPTDAARAYELHACAFITKSLNYSEFRERFQTLVTFWQDTLFHAP